MMQIILTAVRRVSRAAVFLLVCFAIMGVFCTGAVFAQEQTPEETSEQTVQKSEQAEEKTGQTDRVKAGVVEEIEGQAIAFLQKDPHVMTSASKDERDLAQGAAIYVNDVVRTSDAGKVKIRFEDDSVMDVGTESEVRITSMVYDPENAENSNQVFSFFKGLFRFVTGAITRQDPENTTLQAPLATVGIRGTITDHYVDAVDEIIDGTPVRVVASELHALRESSHPDDVVVSYQDKQVVLAKPDDVADVKVNLPVSVRTLTSFERRHFGEVAIEPYSFDPEVGKSLRQGWATPKQ